MNLRLRSIEHAPASLPIWQTLLDDLGNPPPQRVARMLGVSVRTVYRWNAAKAAMLALFWLTRWGHTVPRQRRCRAGRSSSLRLLQTTVLGVRTAWVASDRLRLHLVKRYDADKLEPFRDCINSQLRKIIQILRSLPQR